MTDNERSKIVQWLDLNVTTQVFQGISVSLDAVGPGGAVLGSDFTYADILHFYPPEYTPVYFVYTNIIYFACANDICFVYAKYIIHHQKEFVKCLSHKRI